MNIIPPASAFAPMHTEPVRLVACNRRGDVPCPIDAVASVLLADPALAIADGETDAAATWRVSLVAASLPPGMTPVAGWSVEASASRPRLYVRRAIRAGGLWHLECSSSDRGVR